MANIGAQYGDGSCPNAKLERHFEESARLLVELPYPIDDVEFVNVTRASRALEASYGFDMPGEWQEIECGERAEA